MNYWRQFSWVVLASVLMISCQKEFIFDDTIDNSAAATYLNVSYGTAALQNMDVYLPAGRTTDSTKVIIMIHGGAWATGDKTELTRFVDSFKRRHPDYALFNINYRLSAPPENLFPTQENDVKAAVDFIFAERDKYGISDKFVLIGASAGGHLALLQAYKNNTTVQPKAVVSLTGPTDLEEMYNNPAGGNPILSILLASTVGGTPSQIPDTYVNSSPSRFVSADDPPTLLLYGEVDDLVNTTQPVLLTTILQTAGVAHQGFIYQGIAHVDTWDDFVLFDAFNKIEAFLATYVL